MSCVLATLLLGLLRLTREEGFKGSGPLRLFCAGNIAQRLGDEGGIAIGLLQTDIQIRRHFFGRSKVLGNIVTSGGSFAHDAPLEIASETLATR
ncbi:MAG: hypothetical protein EWM73_03393 [Nitrospira sp.]|nr:MAG: hypothetical protein EWM73_03393 [Nitrospira sp.]